MRSDIEIEAMVDSLYVLIAAEQEGAVAADPRTIDLQTAALGALRWVLEIPHPQFDALMAQTLKDSDEYVEKLRERALRRKAN